MAGPGTGHRVYASGQAGLRGLGLVPLLVFGRFPISPPCSGYGQPHARGQLVPRAVPLFNALHHPLPPLAVPGLAAAGVLPPLWFVGSLAWLSHIGMDWAMGDGLRTADGYLRGRSVWNGRPFRLATNAAFASTSKGHA